MFNLIRLQYHYGILIPCGYSIIYGESRRTLSIKMTLSLTIMDTVNGLNIYLIYDIDFHSDRRYSVNIFMSPRNGREGIGHFETFSIFCELV